MIEPFEIAVPSEVIAELRERLRATRWPGGVVESGGIPLADMRDVTRYWAEEYDWEAHQRALNRLPQFRAMIAGQRLHFIHVRSPAPGAIPLLLLHGWPGSFVEMLGVIPLLSPSFHLVVPSLPGYGFSDPPTSAGMSSARMAALMAELMTALGYDRFAVQGGDWGAGIATWLGLEHPSRLVGLHLNYVPTSLSPPADAVRSPEEEAFRLREAEWAAASGAYGDVQRTRPLTLAYGLSDSPAGLAAWIIEKFREWAAPSSTLPLDALLTNVTVYWVTNTIASSVRLYLEASRAPFPVGARVGVPCGVAHFPFEEPFPPRAWAERVFNVRRWTEMRRGGHFAAFEEPGLLAADVTAFFRTLVA